MAVSEATWLAEGQSPDFDALFTAHWTEIYRLLQRMLGDEAEDAAQEVFLKLHTKPPRPDSNYRAWLYKVATREGLNRLRSRGRQDGLVGRLTRLWSSDPEEDPESITEVRDERRMVRQTLAQMRPLYAQVLLLRHQGMEYSEVAQVLGVSKGSVGTLLLRAERQFAKLHTQVGGRS